MKHKTGPPLMKRNQLCIRIHLKISRNHSKYLFACYNLILLAFNKLKEFIEIHIIYFVDNDRISKPFYFLLLSQMNIINKKILCNCRV